MSQIEGFQHLKIQLEAIKSATNNFSEENCIGHGGFGKVYKGMVILSKGETMVALKRLDRKFGQGESEFWKEIMMLSYYNHNNIVSLLGYCDDDGEKILAYEFASNKSLDTYLASDDLTWVQRLKICVGAARGLAYLHTPAETKLRIVHRDIKSSNILLDHNWNAKISDFGLSKFAPVNNQFTFVVTDPVGTPGYIDPLYHETGLLTKESDVYSFGVVLFEVLCGRLCFGNRDLRPLVGLVREYYKQKQINELVYSNMKDKISTTCLKLFAGIAYRCLSRERKDRPLMMEIVRALEQALDAQESVHRAGILNVKVTRTNPFDAQHHYLLLGISSPDNPSRTFIVEWNEVLTLNVEQLYKQKLVIDVNKVESVNKHRNVGKVDLTPKYNISPDNTLSTSFMIWDDNYLKAGELNVEVLYKPLANDHIQTMSKSIKKAPEGTPKDGGLLVVTIQNAFYYNRRHQHSYVKRHK